MSGWVVQVPVAVEPRATAASVCANCGATTPYRGATLRWIIGVLWLDVFDVRRRSTDEHDSPSRLIEIRADVS